MYEGGGRSRRGRSQRLEDFMVSTETLLATPQRATIAEDSLWGRLIAMTLSSLASFVSAGMRHGSVSHTSRADRQLSIIDEFVFYVIIDY